MEVFAEPAFFKEGLPVVAADFLVFVVCDPTSLVAQKGLSRRALRSTRGPRRDIIFAVVRDNEIVVIVVTVIIRASRKTGCNSKNKNYVTIYAGQ